MRVIDAQVRKLMEEMSKHGKVGRASMMAGMDRKTGKKYVVSGELPSQRSAERNWRTRDDPFADEWPELKSMLKDAPELEAKILFENLCAEKPGKFEPGQVRTLQRRLKEWRATEGPDKTVFFEQRHRAGEAMQTDFTHATVLNITIAGESFPHLLCHMVLPYSNWEWATVCRSESFVALKRGVQSAVFRLGRVPEFHQTDNTSAATHRIDLSKRADPRKDREFNDEYEKFVRYLGMTPRTIGVGKAHQNGDVESLNGALKRRLEQHLKLRRSRDFESVEDYEQWVQGIIARVNQTRSTRISEDLAGMKELSVKRLPNYQTIEVRVSGGSTIRVKDNSYSVPSRLTKEKVKVRIYEDRLEVYYGGVRQLEVERLLGQNRYRINYRHIIWSLVNKPGAFARYRYREEFFPSPVFRRTYDVLCEKLGAGTKTDSQYLRILHRAAAVNEPDVEAALELMLSEGCTPDADKIKVLVGPPEPEIPQMKPYEPNLTDYDGLLGFQMSEVSP